MDHNYEYQLLREIRDLEDTIRKKDEKIAELRAIVKILSGEKCEEPMQA